MDRRQVLQVMGASLALAGMSGCKPVRSDDVVPFVNRPEGFIEGRVEHYATAVLFEGYAQPVLATTSAGRPIKLDGNPEHPAFRGGSTPFMQAAILDLYDPDRSQAPVMGGHPASWADFDAQMSRWRNAWAANHGAGLRILIGPSTSPTLLRQISDFSRSLPQARVHLFDPLEGHGAAAEVELRPMLDQAQVVVSLDDDLLGPGPRQAIHARAWGERHGDAGRDRRMKLFMAETTPTQTGAKADRRIGVPPSRLPLIARALAGQVGLGGNSVRLTASEAAWTREAARALTAARERSLVTAGRFAPPQLRSLAAAINQTLGNIGRTCEIAPSLTFVPQAGTFLDLVRDIEAGRVAALFVMGANPVHQSPARSISRSSMQRCRCEFMPGSTSMKRGRAATGTCPSPIRSRTGATPDPTDGRATIIQPVVRPMYDSRSVHELLAAFTTDQPEATKDIVRQTWALQLASDAAWAEALKTGFVEMPQAPGTPRAYSSRI